jgi:signal transduction histidine kinase
MPSRPRGSIRLWQTGLFIVVIVVAMLILSGTLSAGLTATLTRMAETSELRNASALAQRLAPDFPLAVGGTASVGSVVAEYRGIYGGGIWVYDREGSLLESAHDAGPVEAVLQSARDAVLDGSASYAVSDLRPAGWVVASKPVPGPDRALEGVVVTASSVDQSVAILQAARDRLWVAFWVSLVIAGLLGFGFSELIGRRIQAMSDAAAAMAAGDFEQRISPGFVPAEVVELAVSYNSMAAELGEAFGAIQESRRQIAAVVESMAEGVIAFDASGVVRVSNPEALRLLDTPGREVLGTAVEELTTEPAVRDIVRAGLAGDTAARTVPLGPFVVLLHCTPLPDAAGDIDGAVLLLADVTERHRIEDAQRRFVADASHEMRTPVAALKGMLELLVDGAKDVPEVRDDFMRTMQVEVDRLGRLVADLLTLAQLEAGSLRVAPAPESAADILGGVAGVMQTLAEQAGVHLSVEVPDADVRVLADRDRIVQVLLSFTDNALKHSPRGATVHLCAQRHGDAVRLEVADEGAGIEPEELTRVFERFYRSDAARAGGGAGLGLAIAKEIVDAHGSSIDVRSAPGAGTTFGFELPSA